MIRYDAMFTDEMRLVLLLSVRIVRVVTTD